MSNEISASGATTAYRILSRADAASDMAQAIKDNGWTRTNLSNVKVPSGGGTIWEVDGEGMKAIDGIIALALGKQRAWWRQGADDGGGGTPPDCSSTDGENGWGVNTMDDEAPSAHLCSDCPLSKFDEERESKGCSEFAWLLVFRPESKLPLVVKVPRMSLRNFKDYGRKLFDKDRNFKSVVTRLTLEAAKNVNGKPYARIKFEDIAVLPAGSEQTIRSMEESLLSLVSKSTN